MKNTKKGFTLVELLVVIAILAILATVAVVGYTSFIDKANTSVDQQAVTQMNTLLQGLDVNDKPANLFEAIVALRDANVDMEDYKPLSKDMYFFWVKELNRVVYTDKDYKVVYPENLVETTHKIEDGWYSLSGIVEEDDSWEDAITDGSVSISDGAQLVSLMKSFQAGETKGITEIKLTADIDLRGAAVNFGTVTTNISLIGEKADGTPVTIYGFRNDTEAFKSAHNDSQELTSYGFGLFGYLGNGANVTVKNITIKDAVVDGEGSGVAVLAGYIFEGAKLTVENVTIDNCFVRGEKKTAALVGYLYAAGTLNINGKLTVTNTTVRGGREAAGIIAYVARSTYNGKKIDLYVADDAVISVDVDVAADPTFAFTYVQTRTGYASLAESDGNYANKGEKEYFGITSHDYWDNSTKDNPAKDLK